MSDKPNPSLPSVPGDPQQTTDLPAPAPVPSDQTEDFPALLPADPQQTTDLPAPAHAAGDTGRAGDTSVAPGGPSGETATYNPPPTFDPARTGAYESAGAADTGAEADASVPAGGPTIPGYEILGELGRGGMGVVYKARQVSLNRVVAVKMILAGPNASPAVIARFLAEAQAVARFQHPNLVQVFEVGEFAGMPFFSLEFVDGGTLAKKIAREPQPPRYAAETVEKLALAMQYAHDRGIAHRDLKPANILMAPDGTPKITDFGLAKELEGDSGQTQSGQIMGTPSYMAPEQAEGRPDVGHPADVYALGAILYDLLTGRPPFAGSSVLDTLEMVRTREPVPPGELTGTLPRDLETICLKALQKDLAKRYASARELADDLRRFLDGRPILARPVSRTEKAWRWAKRNPAGALAVALALALLVVPSVLSGFLFVAEAKASESARKESEAKELAQGKQKEAEEALVKEQIALGKERQAVIDKEKARAEEEAAKNREAGAKKVASEQRNEALFTVRAVMLEVDKLLRGRAALAPLRLSILKEMLARLDRIKVPEENGVLDARTEGLGYSRIGQVYFDANRPADAARWTGLSYRLLKKLADENPTDQTALLNLSNISHQLADIEWRLGNGAKARDLHADAHRLRTARVPLLEKFVKDGAPRPDGGKFTPGDVTNARLFAIDSQVLVAVAELYLADPGAAAEHLLAAEKALNAFFPKGVPADQWPVRDRLASVRDRLGIARFHQGRADEAEKLYLAALKEREALLTVPGAKNEVPRLAGLVRESRGHLGDFLLMARSDVSGAVAEYEKALGPLAAALEKTRDALGLQRSVAALRYRLGYAARRRSGFAAISGAVESVHQYAECLRLREGLAKIDPTDVPAKVEWVLALGRNGKTAEAEKLLDELLAVKDMEPTVRFQVVCGLAVASGTAIDEGRAKALRERAFKELEPLVRNWKARGQLELDPDLDALWADPRFKQLLAQPQPK